MHIQQGMLKKLKSKQYIFIAVFGVIGLILIVNSFAVTGFFSVEPEQSIVSCAVAVDDGTASGGAHVQFGNGAGCGLDHSGKTIPSNNYSIPSGAVFMSPSGSDKNSNSPDGDDLNTGNSVDKPVKTLNRAVSITPSGGTIVLRGGEYRDWYNSNNQIRHINKSITFQAYPNEKPWFNGTDIIADGWNKSGSTWVKDWSTPQFCGGQYNVPVNGLSPVSPYLTINSPCTWKDSIADPAYPVAGDPQLAFSNNEQLTQKGALNEVMTGSKSFYYDWDDKKIYISEDPGSNIIELATRPGVMVFGGPYNFAVKGVGFKRYGSNHGGGTGGSVIYVGLGNADPNGQAQFENVVFAENAGAPLAFSGPKNNTFVKNSVFAFNHSNGLTGNGFANGYPGVPNSITIEGSVFNNNNFGNLDTKCRESCGTGGIKLNHMAGFTVKNNIFENTGGSAGGFWCDLDCSNGVIVNNISRNNGGWGIFYEVSSKGMIANNLIYDNGGAGLRVPSATTKIYNNTIINKSGPLVEAAWIFDDSRNAPDSTGAGWPYSHFDGGPDTHGVEFANNLIVGQQPTGARLVNAFSGNGTDGNTTSNQYFSVFDFNAFYYLTGQGLYGWGTYSPSNDNIKTPAQLRSISGQQWERNTITVEGVGDPFVNRGAKDFRLRSDSEPATNLGTTLPNDVADAIGVARGTKPSRGAISWPDF